MCSFVEHEQARQWLFDGDRIECKGCGLLFTTSIGWVEFVNEEKRKRIEQELITASEKAQSFSENILQGQL